MVLTNSYRIEEVENSAMHLRLRLWERRVPRPQWVREISRVLGCGMDRARALLSHETPDETERSLLVERFDLDEHTFTFAPPVFDPDFLVTQNIAYLLESLQHGGKRRLAEHMRVDPATVSSWATSKRTPRRSNLDTLRRYFGLPSSIDLEREPLFLGDDPVTDIQRKRWVAERLAALDREVFKDLFPALQRLLS